MIIKTNKDEFLDYLHDAANIRGDSEQLYIPETGTELSQLIRKLYADKTAFTISAKRTGLVGSAVPQGSVLISTEKLNRIKKIDIAEKTISVEAGVLVADIQTALFAEGFFYAPDPTEENSSIGGNIATNASGAKSFKYGATRNHVLELEIILPDGEELHLKRGMCVAAGYKLRLTTSSGQNRNVILPEYPLPYVKNTAGYYVKKNMDAIDLFIGSEGTLGVITAAKLKIIPIAYHNFSAVLFFPKEEDGLEFIKKAVEKTAVSRENNDPRGINPRAIEYFDSNALKYASGDYPNIPSGSGCAVWIEQELSAEDEDILLSEWYSLFLKFKVDVDKIWVATDRTEEKKIAAFRHSLPARVNEYIAKNNFRKIGTDVAVETKDFRKFYFEIKEMTRQTGLDFVTYGHFGDSHIHLNMLPKNEREFEVARANYDAICRLAIKYNGTVSAEHGIGKTKRHLLLGMFGLPNLKKMALLKMSFDPHLLLNPGNIIPPEIFESLS